MWRASPRQELEMRLSEIFHMGGYGFYVWGSYLITAIAIGGEVLLLMRRRRSLLAQMDHEGKETDEKTS